MPHPSLVLSLSPTELHPRTPPFVCPVCAFLSRRHALPVYWPACLPTMHFVPYQVIEDGAVTPEPNPSPSPPPPTYDNVFTKSL